MFDSMLGMSLSKIAYPLPQDRHFRFPPLISSSDWQAGHAAYFFISGSLSICIPLLAKYQPAMIRILSPSPHHGISGEMFASEPDFVKYFAAITAIVAASETFFTG
jgi:hypothetical protein